MSTPIGLLDHTTGVLHIAGTGEAAHGVALCGAVCLGPFTAGPYAALMERCDHACATCAPPIRG